MSDDWRSGSTTPGLVGVRRRPSSRTAGYARRPTLRSIISITSAILRSSIETGCSNSPIARLAANSLIARRSDRGPRSKKRDRLRLRRRVIAPSLARSGGQGGENGPSENRPRLAAHGARTLAPCPTPLPIDR
jgi:hypothetical protein